MADRKLRKAENLGKLGKIIPSFQFCPTAKIENSDLKFLERNFRDFEFSTWPDMYSDIAKYVKARFDTSNYELDRPLPKGINKKVIGLVKNELRGKVMTEVKMYSYLTGDSDKNDKEKDTKKCVIVNCFNNSF